MWFLKHLEAFFREHTCLAASLLFEGPAVLRVSSTSK